MAYLGLSRTVGYKPFRAMSRKYQDVSWKERSIFFTASVALATMLAWQLGYNTLYVAGGALALSAAIHITLINIGWAPVILVWIINIVFLPIVASAYSVQETTGSDLMFYYSTSMLSLFVASILWTILAVRGAPGKLWVTLTLSFFLQSVVGAFIAVLMNNHYSIAVGITLGGIGVMLRVFLHKKNKFGSLTALDETENKKIIAKISHTNLKPLLTAKNFQKDKLEALVIAENARGLYAIYGFKTSSPLTITNDRIKHEGKYLEDFIAPIIVESLSIAKTAKNKGIHTLIILKDSAFVRGAKRITLYTAEGRLVGTATFVHPDHVGAALAEINKIDLNPDARELIRKAYAKNAIKEVVEENAA